MGQLITESQWSFYEREGWLDSAHAFVKLLAEGLDWPPSPR